MHHAPRAPLVQVKAFRSTPLLLKPARGVPTHKTCELCVGDFCRTRQPPPDGNGGADADAEVTLPATAGRRASCVACAPDAAGRRGSCVASAPAEEPTGAGRAAGESEGAAAGQNGSDSVHGIMMKQLAGVAAPACRRMPYRWLVLDRLLTGVEQHVELVDSHTKKSAMQAPSCACTQPSLAPPHPDHIPCYCVRTSHRSAVFSATVAASAA